jgi:hypothetical protein
MDRRLHHVADDVPARDLVSHGLLPRLAHHGRATRVVSPVLAPCDPFPSNRLLSAFSFLTWDSSVATQEICQNWPVPTLLPASSHDAQSVERTLNNDHILACLIKLVKQAVMGLATAVPCACRWPMIPWTRLTAWPCR